MGSIVRKSLVLVVLCLAVAPLYGQCPGAPGLTQLDVSAEVASSTVPDFAAGNIARAPDAVHFNSNHRATHNSEFVNDGNYGDSKGIFFRGIPSSGEIYVGIAWTGGTRTIREVAIGRDNVNHDQGGTDRAMGAYTFEYTTDTFTSVSCGNETTNCDDLANTTVTWCPMGLADDHLAVPYVPNGGPSARIARRRYTLPANLTGVTAVRVVTVEENVIDELEIGSSVGSLFVSPCPAAGTLTFLDESPERSPNSVPEFADGNLARAPDAVFFNSSYRAGHEAELINDGVYGDSNGIYFRHSGGGPTSGEVYVGIHWTGGGRTIREVAIGRDSVNHDSFNRAVGAYTFEFTTDVFTSVSCPAEGVVCDDSANTSPAVKWCPMGVANEHSTQSGQTGPSTRGARRRYTLPADLTGVTAVRVLSQVENVIDELEIGDSAGSLAFVDPCPPTPGLAFVAESGELEAEDVPDFAVGGNLARAPDAVVFNSSYRAGHEAQLLNNGRYGDSDGIYFRHNAGEPTSGEVYAGIRWGSPKTIREVAIGRDAIFHNHFNRAVGAYTFEYTTDVFTSVSCGDDTLVCDDSANVAVTWCPLGLANDHSSQSGQTGPSTRGARRLYELPADLTGVTAVRVLSQVENVIDELEIFGDAPVVEGGLQLPGNSNQDSSLDLSDVITLLGFLFQGNPASLPCSTQAANRAFLDINTDTAIDLSDGIFLLAFLFQGGPPPDQGQSCIAVVDCPQDTMACP